MRDHDSTGPESSGARPDWAGHLRERLSSLSLTPAREAEIVEELSQHLDERYDELRNAGSTDTHARQTALDELLDRDALASQMRSLRQNRIPEPIVPGTSSRWPLADCWLDIRYAARMVAKQRGFAAAAIVTLALGIGATTAIFSVVNAVLIRPLAYPDSDRLVRIVHAIGGIDQPFFSDTVFLAYTDNTRTFEDVGVYTPAETATITGIGQPEEVRTLRASRTLLTTLGVRPLMGRWMSAAEDAPGAPNVVILTSGYWQRRLGGAGDVLSRTLTINGRPHQIIGVMPEDFRFTREFEILVPLRVSRANPIPPFRLLGVARLKPGVTLSQADADSGRILKIWLDSRGEIDPAFQSRYRPALVPLKDDFVGNVGTTLWILMGAIAVVLIMACANVANLLLVRADERRHELAIRAALGARWTRMARQLLLESLTLAVTGGVLGVGVAYAGLRALVVTGPANLPRLQEISLDPVALGFAFTISLLSGLFFGIFPILKYAQPQLVDAFAARGDNLTRDTQRSQRTLVAAQVAFALVLLVAAGLMIRSYQALRSVDAGFTQPQHLETFTISLPGTVVADPERVMRMQQDILDRVAAIPGVSSAAFTTRVPMGPGRNSTALTIEGKPDDGRTPPNRQVKIISPGLFRTQGTPIIVGRDFTWSDLYDRRDVAIVSENLAREVWGSAEAALGKRFREYYDPDSSWHEVVGVAGDVYDDGADRQPPATLYWPAKRNERLFGVAGYQARRVTFMVRSERAGTAQLLEQIQAAVWSVNGNLPLAQAATLDEVFGQSLARTSFTLVLLGVAGTMALLLGASGLYGVIAYAVSQRRREIGIRMALGAQAREIRRLFVQRGLVLGGIGLVIGLGGALALTRLMESLLFGVSPLDPLTFVTMPVVLALAAVLASYLPARRAMAVDPIETMRGG